MGYKIRTHGLKGLNDLKSKELKYYLYYDK